VRRSVIEVRGFDQPRRMKTQSVGPKEVRSGQEVMVSCGRTNCTILVAAMSTFEHGAAVPRAVNGGGVEKRVGEREHDVDV